MTGMRTRRKSKQVYFDNGWARGYLVERADSGDPSLCRVLDRNIQDWRFRVRAAPEDASTASPDSRESDPDSAEIRPSDLRSKDRELRSAHRRRTDTPAADVLSVIEGLRARWAYPWVTPVIGPGCLDTSDETGPSRLARRPAVLAKVVSSWSGLLPTGADPAEVVERFAWTLIERKVTRPPRRPESGTTEGAEQDDLDQKELEFTARLLLCAALAAWLYNQAAALSGAPPADDADPVDISRTGQGFADLGDELHRTIAVPLRGHLEALAGETDEVFIQQLVRDMANHLGDRGGTVRRLDATVLAELAWHYLTHETSHYAGWQEVLLHASMQSGSADRRMRWPNMSNRATEAASVGLLTWLRKGLESTTTESWRTRLESKGTPRDQLYDTVGDVIVEQAALYRLTSNVSLTKNAFHPGVAFVTSFDLELEMALLHRQSAFVMLVPFEVIHSDANNADAHLLWLYSVVRPDDEGITDIAQVRTRRDWRFVDPANFLDTLHADEFTADARRDPEDVARPAGLPVVVRLAGSPLMEPPSGLPHGAAELLASRGIRVGAGASNYRLQPAVVIDELSALLHVSADHGVFQDQNMNLHRSGLPEQLLRREGTNLTGRGSGGDTVAKANANLAANRDARFWLLLGVQIGDNAIRARLASLLSAAGMETPEEFRMGVAVVRRSQPADRDILHWLGLDVVSDQAFAVINDLRHYARHLRHYPFDRRDAGMCPISDRSDG